MLKDQNQKKTRTLLFPEYLPFYNHGGQSEQIHKGRANHEVHIVNRNTGILGVESA